jgi:hypothetical protein
MSQVPRQSASGGIDRTGNATSGASPAARPRQPVLSSHHPSHRQRRPLAGAKQNIRETIKMKRKTNTRVATSLALAFASLDAASAAVLVSYPFNNSSDGSSGFAYSSLDATVLASAAVSKGAGLGQYSVGTDFGSIE